MLETDNYEKFKKILSPKKLYKYKRAEGKFAREFMRILIRKSRCGAESTR